MSTDNGVINRYMPFLTCWLLCSYLYQQVSNIFFSKASKKMAQKLTQEDFLEQMHKIHGNNIDFSDAVYVNDRTKIKCKCNICENTWEALPNNLKGCKNRKPKGCPKCAHRIT